MPRRLLVASLCVSCATPATAPPSDVDARAGGSGAVDAINASGATGLVDGSVPPATIALAQYEIRGDASTASVVARATGLVRQAADSGAALLVLPELFVLDAWPLASSDGERAITERIAREVTPAVLIALKRAARELKVAVLAGSVPELRGDQLYNAAHLYFTDGREVVQDKVHLTAWGRRIGMTPGRDARVFDAPWGRTVILICYDVEFPSLSAALSEDAPEVWLVPSMTESEAGQYRVRWTAQARAVEHHAFVLIAPTVGQPAPDWTHHGRAVALTPQAPGFPGVLAEAKAPGTGLTFAALDLARLRDSRRDTTFFPARDERGASTPGLRVRD